MAENKKPDTSKIEVKKATKSGKVDKRRKSPLRVETQTKSAASRVISAGNKAAAKTRGVEKTLASDRSFASVAGKPDVEIPKTKGMSATAAAKADARGTDLEPRSSKDSVQLTKAELASIQEERDAAKAKRKAERTAKPIFNRSATEGETRQMRLASAQFMMTPKGKRKEELRRTTGRLLQSGSHVVPDDFHMPCQTPNCDSMIPWHSKKVDVVCPSCAAQGDQAGKEYRDTPRIVGSTGGAESRGGDRRKP